MDLLCLSVKEIKALTREDYIKRLTDLRTALEKFNIDCTGLQKTHVDRSILITDNLMESVGSDDANTFLETAISVAAKMRKVEREIKISAIKAQFKLLEAHMR
ncbi:MAG: hypothetical protein Q9212_001538 [Teloschistes hypoglaucus]